jgi:hypothetical protein
VALVIPSGLVIPIVPLSPIVRTWARVVDDIQAVVAIGQGDQAVLLVRELLHS